VKLTSEGTGDRAVFGPISGQCRPSAPSLPSPPGPGTLISATHQAHQSQQATSPLLITRRSQVPSVGCAHSGTSCDPPVPHCQPVGSLVMPCPAGANPARATRRKARPRQSRRSGFRRYGQGFGQGTPPGGARQLWLRACPTDPSSGALQREGHSAEEKCAVTATPQARRITSPARHGVPLRECPASASTSPAPDDTAPGGVCRAVVNARLRLVCATDEEVTDHAHQALRKMARAMGRRVRRTPRLQLRGPQDGRLHREPGEGSGSRGPQGPPRAYPAPADVQRPC